MRYTITEPQKISQSRGYTLIEMAIAIIIIGVLFAGGLTAYDSYIRAQRVIKAETNISQATDAIGTFRAQFGRYPCPADVSLSRDDMNYGREGDCTDTSVAAGSCDPVSNAYCVEGGARLVDVDNNPLTPPVNPRIRRGSLPFRDMNMLEENAYDGYGNRMMYAVTENLTRSADFNAQAGGIGLVDDQGAAQDIVLPADSAHFVILAPGPNQRGGFSSNGNQSEPCPALGPESENCNTSAAQARYVYTQNKKSVGSAQYDDLVSFYSLTELEFWQYADASLATGGFDIKQRPPGVIEIGDPAKDISPNLTGRRLELRGDIMGAGGNMYVENKVMVDEICDNDFTIPQCFNPRKIAGALMTPCAAGEFAYGIFDDQMKCTDEIAVQCGANQFIKGINLDGSLNCVNSSCPSKNVNYCSTNVNIPSGSYGDVFTVNPGVGTLSVDYTCNPATGNWEAGATAGSCTCTESDVTLVNQACEDGFVGNRDVRTVVTCDTGVEVTAITYPNDNCVCVDGSTRQIGELCPSGPPNWWNAGSRTATETLTCPGVWARGPWDEDACECVEKTQVDENSCYDIYGTGYSTTEIVTDELYYRCPGGWDSAWTRLPDSCSCTSGNYIIPASCPSGQVGPATETRNYDCSTGNDTSVSFDYSQCVQPQCVWKTFGSATPVNADLGYPQPGSRCDGACGTVASCQTVVQPGLKYNTYDCQCTLSGG